MSPSICYKFPHKLLHALRNHHTFTLDLIVARLFPCILFRMLMSDPKFTTQNLSHGAEIPHEFLFPFYNELFAVLEERNGFL